MLYLFSADQSQRKLIPDMKLVEREFHGTLERLETGRKIPQYFNFLSWVKFFRNNLWQELELRVAHEGDGEQIVHGRRFVEGEVASFVEFIWAVQQRLTTSLPTQHEPNNKCWERIIQWWKDNNVTMYSDIMSRSSVSSSCCRGQNLFAETGRL